MYESVPVVKNFRLHHVKHIFLMLHQIVETE